MGPLRLALQYLLSVLFIVQMYLVMAIFAVVFLPWALVSPAGAFSACHNYTRWVAFSARWLLGLRCEVRGEVPQDPVVVAAKHQSFLDILMIFGALPRPFFIMKKELIWAPILGWYALRLGCIPVDRGKRGQAIKTMLARVASGKVQGGQLVIFPQGTRVAPGASKPYKIGIGALYKDLGQDCVPVATNVGVFWPRHGILRQPGTAVVEFLPRVPAGLPVEEFMTRIETAIETRTDALLVEAGHHKE